jgi:hypothetical protein
MLRIVAIVSLIFYLSVSIGVHVDVDTCCKSIAGLSIFSKSVDHSQELEEDCCVQKGTPSCHPITESNPEGCPSDCVYIQVLMDTPPPALSSLEIIPTPIDKVLIAMVVSVPVAQDVSSDSKAFTHPPSIAMNEDLYLCQGSYITYG